MTSLCLRRQRFQRRFAKRHFTTLCSSSLMIRGSQRSHLRMTLKDPPFGSAIAYATGFVKIFPCTRVEQGNDLGLRSDHGADSKYCITVTRVLRFEGAPPVKKKHRQRKGRKKEREKENEYWRCAAFKYCIQVTFRDRILSFPRAHLHLPGIPRASAEHRDRTSHNYRKVSKETKEEATQKDERMAARWEKKRGGGCRHHGGWENAEKKKIINARLYRICARHTFRVSQEWERTKTGKIQWGRLREELPFSAFLLAPLSHPLALFLKYYTRPIFRSKSSPRFISQLFRSCLCYTRENYCGKTLAYRLPLSLTSSVNENI